VRLLRDPAAPPDAAPEFGSRRLAGGDDGAALDAGDFDGSAAADGEPRGLAALAECPEIALVYVPGASIEVARKVVTHCEALRYRFGVLDGPFNLPAGFEPRSAIGASSRAALYAPWLLVGDLADSRRSRAVPPGGHVAGAYARTDLARGVHKAPANEEIVGATGVTQAIDATAQERFNPRGVNVLREFPERGLRVWGARTLSADAEWKYVNVRRLFIYLEHSIDRGTQWAVFEPNGERTWARVRDSVRNFLRTVWREGALLGRTEDEAFFVRCDRTTMTQNDLENGRLICVVGAAPIKPAEFIVFRIGQHTAERNP
jgi:phage tail sheath protein FI